MKYLEFPCFIIEGIVYLISIKRSLLLFLYINFHIQVGKIRNS